MSFRMTYSKFWMFKELEELQIKGCQTEVCLVGGGGEKVLIHCAMLFADHIQPNSAQDLVNLDHHQFQ